MKVQEIVEATGRSKGSIYALLASGKLKGELVPDTKNPKGSWEVQGTLEEAVAVVEREVTVFGKRPRHSRKTTIPESTDLKDRLYSTLEVAKMIGMSDGTVWKFAKEHSLGMQGPGGKWLYNRHDTLKILDRYRPKAMAAAAHGNGSTATDASLTLRLNRLQKSIDEGRAEVAELKRLLAEVHAIWTQ